MSCSGLENSKDHFDCFHCRHCLAGNQGSAPAATTDSPTDAATARADVKPSELPPIPLFANVWKTTNEKRGDEILEAYEDVVDWKPRLMLLNQSMSSLATPRLALPAAMILPHVILPRTKAQNDASIAQMMNRRRDLFRLGTLTALMTEARALQLELTIESREKKDELVVINALMNNLSISSATKQLLDGDKRGILSLNELFNGKTCYSKTRSTSSPG